MRPFTSHAVAKRWLRIFADGPCMAYVGTFCAFYLIEWDGKRFRVIQIDE